VIVPVDRFVMGLVFLFILPRKHVFFIPKETLDTYHCTAALMAGCAGFYSFLIFLWNITIKLVC